MQPRNHGVNSMRWREIHLMIMYAKLPSIAKTESGLLVFTSAVVGRCWFLLLLVATGRRELAKGSSRFSGSSAVSPYSS